MKRIIGILILFSLCLSLVFADEFYQCRISVDSSKEECRSINTAHNCQIYDHSFDGVGIPIYCSGYCLERSQIAQSCAKISVEKSTNLKAHEGFASKFKSLYYGSFYGGVEDDVVLGTVEFESVGKVLSFDGQVSLNKGLKTIRIGENMELFGGDKLSIGEGAKIKIYLVGRGALTIYGPTTFQIPSWESLVDLDKDKAVMKSGFFANTYYKLKSYFTPEESQGLADGVRG